jgi:hypothetical protein
MATILTKKKDTTGAPVAGDLTNSTGGAELAVNTADKRLYTKDSGGNVVEVGTNPGAAVTFTAGTVSAPAITTTGDTNTGIFFPAADTIAFAEGGAEAMRINSDSQVVTTAGTASLPAITTTGDVNTGIFFPSADTIAFAEGGAESMRIDSSGNVGIGTTSPNLGGVNKAITLNSAASTNASYELSINGTFIGSMYTNTADSSMRFGTWQNAPMVFLTNSTERMRIDSSGNVGIGTSSPGGRLGVQSASSNGALTNSVFVFNDGSGSGTGARLSLGVRAEENRSAGVSGFYDGTGTSLGFYTVTTYASGSQAERARITSGGYFKASNNGTYINSTGTYHEFYQTADGTAGLFTGYNNSYTNPVVFTQVQRSANAAYSFFDGYSGLSDLEFRLYGDGNGKCDGAWTGGGADYAEFFESANGQALTLGATVVLDGNKVREATDQDPASAIIGVVRPKEPSRASAMIGNSAWSKWSKKYLTDDFDRYIMEDHDVVEWEEQVLEREAIAAVEAVVDEEGNEVSPAVPAQEAVYKTKQHSYESHNIPAGITVPTDATVKTHDDKGNKFQHYKLNPAWDKDAEYINRENRPEWNIIGLLGQVKILKGQPVGDRWTKMRDVSATVEEWMIR